MSYLLDEEKTWIQRDFGLDRRLVKGLSKLGFIYPTLVQSETIPIAMQGKDVLVRARTGSGKTVAFALPVLHKLLSDSGSSGRTASVRCIILAPTKELCKQIEKNMEELIYYCKDDISIYAIGDDAATVQQFKLQKKPDVIVSTPAKIVQQLKAGSLDISGVSLLVIDEADLILSFGYSEDVNFITTKMPKIFQGLLMSATLSPELDKFRRVVLHNPAVIKLEESTQIGHLLQFYLECSESDKFLVLYVFIKLGLLQGKGLIFVNDVNKCYRLKLFLQQFFISTAVLNAELPTNSRLHILEEFNRGVFDFLIATDAKVDDGEYDDQNDEDNDNDIILEDGDNDDEENDEDDDDKNLSAGSGESSGNEGSTSDEEANDSEEEEESPSNHESAQSEAEAIKEEKVTESKKKKRSRDAIVSDEDYGVSRGIDFQNVSFVINFDLPLTSSAYTHRIGRTARGGATGTALSFVTAMPANRKGPEVSAALRDALVLREVQAQQPRLGRADGESNALANIRDGVEENDNETNMQPAPLQFNMKELESFRYRVEDTLRSVTTVAVRELRAAEIKREILNSEKLKDFFAENPNDLKVLRHDKTVLHPIRQKAHLKHVPSYLVPSSLRGVANTTGSHRKRRKIAPGTRGLTQEQRIQRSKQKDPLLAGASSSTQIRSATADEVDHHREEKPENKLLTSKELERTQTALSGRKQWQQRHKKGKFSAKNVKGDPLRLPGSFAKPKAYYK